MTKEATVTKNGTVDSLCVLGKNCITVLKGAALVMGGIGSLAIIGSWILVLAIPIFLVISFVVKFLVH